MGYKNAEICECKDGPDDKRCVIDVFNLSTTECETYMGLSPREAVVTSFYRSIDEYHPEFFNYKLGIVSKTGKSVSCGNFCTLIQKCEREGVGL